MSKSKAIKPNENFYNEIPKYILNRPLEQPLEILDREVVEIKEEYLEGKIDRLKTIVDNKTIILESNNLNNE